MGIAIRNSPRKWESLFAARPATRPAAALASRAAPLQLYTIYSHYIVISK